MMILVELFITVLLVDFGSGLIHWTEDTFWTEKTPIIGNWLIKPNVLHHTNGSVFVKKSWFQSSWDLLIAGIAVLLICKYFGLLSWHVYLFVLIMVNANQIHKWSHMNPTKIPIFIKYLQQLRIIQAPKHHANHHRDKKNTHYCVITDFTNPLLDNSGFWRMLESLLIPHFKAPRRIDIDGITYD
jgi:plasmanylethanolamine desaturase